MNYAEVLKAKLAPPAASAQVNSINAATQQRVETATPTVSPTTVNSPVTTGTNYASRLNSTLGNGSIASGLAGKSGGLADMLARARGMRSGYSAEAGDGSVQTSSQGSVQGDTSTPFKYMSLDTATGQAKDKLDPTYNSLRDRMDASYSSDRDNIKALLAARYGGLQGTRGGRAQSSYDQNTQEHSVAINDLENKRVSAVNEMAQAIQDKDYQRAFQAYQLQKQLEYQQQQLEMQQEQFDQTMDLQQSQFGWQKDYQTQQLQMQKDAQTMSNEQFMLNYGLSKDEFALKEKQSNFDMDMSNKEYDWKTNPDTWYNKLYTEGASLDNDYKQAQINKMYSNGSGGSSGGSGGAGNSGGSGGFDTKTSKSAADAIIADMQNEKLYLINNGGEPALYSQYMAQSIKDAQDQGIWDLLTDSDKAKVYALITQTTNY